MILLDSFCKCYDDEIAVSDLSFEVKPGQVLGLVGRNGAGKTTTLRALTGIIPPTSGRVYVDGFEIQENPIEVKHRTAYVPDDPQLFNDLTVEQHLLFTASVYKVKNATQPINCLLSRFELSEKRDTLASGLSRGMRQKLAICCAYLHEPAALLLDEPMTGLDPPGIRNLKKSISEHANRGAAVIISSHLLAMVEDICTHLLIIDRGRKKFFGTLEDVKAKVQYENRNQQNSSLEDVFFAALDGHSELNLAPDYQIDSTATPTEVL